MLEYLHWFERCSALRVGQYGGGLWVRLQGHLFVGCGSSRRGHTRAAAGMPAKNSRMLAGLVLSPGLLCSGDLMEACVPIWTWGKFLDPTQ